MSISILHAGAVLKDKDGNVGKVVGLSANDVTLVNNTISAVSGLDTRVTDAVNSIASVKETAEAAKTAADSASTTANAASATASNANTTANEALTSAEQALTNITTVDRAWRQAKTDVDATLLTQSQQITRIDSDLTTTDATVTSLKNYDEQVYWPLIEKNSHLVSTVAITVKDEATGIETYRALSATGANYGSTRLMQYDEESELNNDVVTRALYAALEARVSALESKLS